MDAIHEQTIGATDHATTADLRGLCRCGGYAAFALLIYSLGTLVQVAVLGAGAPSEAESVFAMLHEHRIEGLLRLDLATILAVPLYYLVFLGLFAALRGIDLSNAILSTSLAFGGTTLVLATPTALPLLRLSDEFFRATTGAQKAQYLAAGQAVLATDIWHHTGAAVGAVLLQAGAVLICVVMLRGGEFSRLTAWLGIVMHGLDLAHVISGWFVPIAGIVLMAVAGILYPFWFFLIGRRLLHLAAKKMSAPVESLVAAP